MLWGSPHDYLPSFAPTRCISRGVSPQGYQWVPIPIPQPSSAPAHIPKGKGRGRAAPSTIILRQ